MSFFFFPSVALDSIIHPLVKTGRTKCDLCGTAFAVFWRRGRDSNPCGVAPKRFSRPPRYDRFDTSQYMNLSFDRNHQIFNCFRNSFRNALWCCFRSAEKVRCCKAFQGFCDRYARKFSRPPRYDRFDTSPNYVPERLRSGPRSPSGERIRFGTFATGEMPLRTTQPLYYFPSGLSRAESKNSRRSV